MDITTEDEERAASEPASPPVEKSDPESAGQPDTLVPDAQVCRELGGISLMTLNRRDNYDAGFPPKVSVNGRNYRFRSALEAYKKRLLAVAVRSQKKRIALRQR
jgi:hypothetical protein